MAKTKCGFLSRNSKILVAGLAAAALACICFASRGLFPFGTLTLTQVDAWQIYTPTLYSQYDLLHGGGAFSVMQATFCGGDFVRTLISIAMSPINWLCFLLPRTLIPYYTNIAMLICICASAVTATLMLFRIFPKNGMWNVVLGLAYAFGPFTFYNSTITVWYQFIILFPLLIVALRRLVKSGKGLFFALLAAYFVAGSVQTGFMALMFTLFGTGIYIWFYAPKKERVRLMYRVGVYTLAALLLSAFAALPSVSTLFTSSRASENASLTSGIWSNLGVDALTTQVYTEKLYMLLAPLPVGIIIVGLFKKRVRLSRYIDNNGRSVSTGAFTALLLLLLFTAFCEHSNLLWHLGSYAWFPLRYGFMITAVMLLVAAGCISEQTEISAKAYDKPKDITNTDDTPKQNQSDRAQNKRRTIRIIACILAIFAVIAAVILSIRFQTVIASDIRLKSSVEKCIITLSISVLLCAAAACAAWVTSGSSSAKAASAQQKSVSCVQKFAAPALALLIVCSFAFFGLYSCVMAGEVPSDYPALARMYESEIGGDALIRVKEERSVANRNFGKNAGVMTIGGFNANVPSEYVETMLAMGYTKAWTSVVSTGGTLLSDALLRNGYIMGFKDGDTITALYDYYDNYGTADDDTRYTVYKNDMLFPSAFTTGDEILNVLLDAQNPLESTNAIYRALTYEEDDILLILSDGEARQGGGLRCTADCGQGSVLYIDLAADRHNVSISVNDRMIDMSDEFYGYSEHRLVELGYYQGETVIEVFARDALFDYGAVRVGVFDVSKLKDLCADLAAHAASHIELDGASLIVEIEAPAESVVFIPVATSAAYKCTVNGSETPLTTALGSFCAVRVNAGVNKIVITNSLSATQALGFAVTLVGAAMLLLHELLRRKHAALPQWWAITVSACYTAILAAACAALIVAPLCLWLIAVAALCLGLA